MSLHIRKPIRVARHGGATAVAFCLLSAIASVTGSGIGEHAGSGAEHAIEAQSPRVDTPEEALPTLLCRFA